MATQWLLPGYGFVDDDGSDEYLVPSAGFINEQGEAPPATPLVSSSAADDINTTTVTLNGSLTDMGEEAAVDVYFEWREVGAGSWETTSPQELTETGVFDDELTGLDEGTDYEFRAVVNYDTTEYAYGSTLSFQTLSSGGGNEGGLFFCHG